MQERAVHVRARLRQQRRVIAISVAVLTIGLGFGSRADAVSTTHTVLNTNNAGVGSFRQAITDANSNADSSTIIFDIPDAEVVHTIAPSTFLPAITEPVTIDGYTQPGSTQNTLAVGSDATLHIELDASGELDNGLTVAGFASNVVIRGLAINSAPANGIQFGSNTATNYKIEGCFIGTDAAGTTAKPNGQDGITASSGSNITIGGNTPAKRNIISGNGDDGVSFVTSSSSNNIIQGNIIGLSRIGNPMANLNNGIAIEFDSTGNRILDNVISSNLDLGIDLGDNGDTPNDGIDRDIGPNNLQNFPVLTSATVATDGSMTIAGRLRSRPRKVFTIQFFANVTGAQGAQPLGQLNVRTNRRGNASFRFISLDGSSATNVTATATSFPAHDTSEFSAPRTVVFL